MNRTIRFVVSVAVLIACTAPIDAKKDDVCRGTRVFDKESSNSAVLCAKDSHTNIKKSVHPIKARRYDVENLGRPDFFHGWADVQGQGAANDYCRIVESGNKVQLACALAGTHGESDMNFNSEEEFEKGHPGTWYMRDQDGDGRDDYCRCAGSPDIAEMHIICAKAGHCGFRGSFNRTSLFHCQNMVELKKLRPEFGEPWKMPTSR